MTSRSHHDFKREGVAYLPAARLEEGLVPGLSLEEHFILAEGKHGLFIDRRGGRGAGASRIAAYNIKGRRKARSRLSRAATSSAPSSPSCATSSPSSSSSIRREASTSSRRSTSGPSSRSAARGAPPSSSSPPTSTRYSSTAIASSCSSRDRSRRPSAPESLGVEELGRLIGGKGWESSRPGCRGGRPCARATPARRTLFQAAAVLLALALTTLVLIATKAPPLAAYASIARGAVGSWGVASDVLVAWVPLLLVTSGLLVTFTVGLWNIGIEGQITFGGDLRHLGAARFQARLSGSVDPGLVIGDRDPRRDGGRRALGDARRGSQDLRRRQRDLRRTRAQLRRDGGQPLAHIRPLEEARRRLDVGHRALRPEPLAARR